VATEQVLCRPGRPPRPGIAASRRHLAFDGQAKAKSRLYRHKLAHFAMFALPCLSQLGRPAPSTMRGDLVEILDPLRHHKHYQSGPNASPYAGGSSFMERLSEAVASGMGTVSFLVISSAIIIGWVLINHVAQFLTTAWHGLLDGKGFDPEPFILLNLVFSAVAFYTGALVIIAQKAQTRTDKASEEASAKHRDELAQFQSDLLAKNTNLTEQIHTLAQQLTTLTQDVHRATCQGGGSAPEVAKVST
jgi:uncharacterized membrane protein